jgi:hypothetical protein
MTKLRVVDQNLQKIEAWVSSVFDDLVCEGIFFNVTSLMKIYIHLILYSI